MKVRAADAGSAESEDQLLADQYKGKESLRPIYEKLLKEISKLGKDIEIAPKKAAVSFRRKRQFALVQPSTKTRIDLGLKIKDKEQAGRLEGSGPFGTMCTHRIKLADPKEVDKEVLSWIKEAYEGAG
jgi:predicted transport protein